ncbi:hypothetical protein [Actinoplanes siamensis]|nr:hypothetical protein [Actinoplanes siamensis]
MAISPILATLVTVAASVAPTPAPDGRIPLAALREATLDVPGWPADNVRGPSGPLRFHDGSVTIEPRETPDGQPPYAQSVTILSAAYGDVDRDGADETVVLLGALIEGGSKQLVAYDRDRAGHIVALGRVAATTGEVRDIRADSARVDAAGAVSALVGDYQRCCDDDTPQIWQTRSYALRDGRFEQVGGPTRMPLNPHVTQTRVTAGKLALGAATGGYRYGTVDVTLTHRRGAHPEKITLWFYPPDGLERTGAGWPAVTTRPDGFGVTVPAPPAGGSVTHTFGFRRPAALSGGELSLEITTAPPMGQALPWDSSAAAPVS